MSTDPQQTPVVTQPNAASEICQRCGGPNAVVPWFVPSPLWNLVMRCNDINGDPLYGDLVCPACFLAIATEAGVAGTWRLTVDPLPDDLVTVTPSGRVWDDEAGLWVTGLNLCAEDPQHGLHDFPGDDYLHPCLKCGEMA
jgi:hypothetical protein